MNFDAIERRLPAHIAAAMQTGVGELTEIRLHAGRCSHLVYANGTQIETDPVDAAAIEKLALSLMRHSYHTHEDELRQGYFTTFDGCRVGVSGSYAVCEGEVLALREIGSVCIRVAREVHGCAEALVERITKADRLQSAIVLSPPGMGKTTLLRDAARLLSERGFFVGVADERHELAACVGGVPTLDVGTRSDVCDGCPKAEAMQRLIRSMAPDVIITDEIGGSEDVQAVREASRRGVALLVSAHASSIADFARGAAGTLLSESIFDFAALLGDRPGHIASIEALSERRAWS